MRAITLLHQRKLMHLYTCTTRTIYQCLAVCGVHTLLRASLTDVTGTSLTHLEQRYEAAGSRQRHGAVELVRREHVALTGDHVTHVADVVNVKTAV